MGRIQQILLEQRDQSMHGKNRFELGKNPLLLPGILRSANWLLLSADCSVLADVRYENAKMAARRITDRVQSRSWFPADAERRHRGEYVDLVQSFR